MNDLRWSCLLLVVCCLITGHHASCKDHVHMRCIALTTIIRHHDVNRNPKVSTYGRYAEV